METLTFKKIDEIKKFYNENNNTYIFKENNEYIDIYIKFNLDIKSNIIAGNITAKNIFAQKIIAKDIFAEEIMCSDIVAGNIIAQEIFVGNIIANSIDTFNITFIRYCISYNNITCIKCRSIKKNAIIETINGKIENKE